MAIVKRLTKGSALTHAELDGNFTDLDGRVGTLESTADSDSQTLTLTGDTLSISGGNSVDLSKYTDTVFSGDYDDLTNKPTIPADVSDLTDTGNLLGGGPGDIILNSGRINNSVSDGGGLQIEADTDFEIKVVSGGDTAIWSFEPNNNGRIQFPDGSTQTTAYPGLQTSLDGDVTGSVFADDSTLLVDGVNGSIPYSVISDVQVTESDLLVDFGNIVATQIQTNGLPINTTATGTLTVNGQFTVEESFSSTPTTKFFEIETGAGNNRLLRTGVNMSAFAQGNGPQLDLTSYRSSPANGDAGPELALRASTGASVNDVIATIGTQVTDTTDGDVTSKILFTVQNNGSNVTPLTITGSTVDMQTADQVSISNENGAVDIYGEVEFNNGVTAFQPGNSVSFNGPVNFASATVTGLQSIVQSQIVGVNNFSTTISQDQWYTKFAKVDEVGDAFGGTSTDVYEIRLGNNRLQFENVVVATGAYVQNSTPSGSLYINAGAGTVVTGGMGGDLYLSGGERTFGSAVGGNVFVNSNGGDIFIGQLANTAEIRIGGGPDYASQNPTTFYGDVNFASGKSVTFTGVTVTGLPATDYGDITNTPAIPADVSDLTDTGNLLFSGNYGDLTGKPSNGGVAYQFGYSAHNAVGTSPFGEFTVNSVPMIISVTATANVQGARIEISGITASTSVGTGLITVQRRLNGGGWLVWSSFIIDGALDHFNHSFIDFYDTAVASNDVSAGDSVEYRLVNATADNTNYPGSTAGTVEFELFLGFQFTATEIPVSFGLTQPGV